MTADKNHLFHFALRVAGCEINFTPEYKFHPKRKWRFDFAHLATRVAVEVEGGQWAAGGGRHNRDADREKYNTAAALGWRVLRFSTQTLENDPTKCVQLTLDAIGWKGDGGG